MQDLAQGLALSHIGAFIDDRLHAAVALRDFAGPFDGHDPIEAAEFRVVEIAFLDMPDSDRLAEAIRGPRIKLARTPPRAVAVRELGATDHLLVTHG
jgi:hypothetical protein